MLRFVAPFVVTVATCASCSTYTAPSPVPLQENQPAPPPAPPATPRPQPPIMGPAIPLSVGTVIEAAVGDSDPKCYYDWDANAGCRWFSVVPSQSGDLTVTLRPGRPRGELDLFVVIEGNPRWTPQGADGISRLTVPAVADSEIDILVIAYVFPEPFFIETAFR